MESSAQDKSAEFEAAVVNSFRFLEVEHGFVRRVSQPQKYTRLVTYENAKLYVFLSYGPPEYEPGMSFGRRGVDDVPGGCSFYPADLIALDCCKNWTWNKSHGDAFGGWIAELGRLLAECGAQCLDGNPWVLAQMKARRNKLAADWKQEEMLRVVQAQIDSAWKEKDYGRVLQLYKSIDDLSDLDKKRIAYAMSHL